ncbi:MAG TPA: acetate/propionate family kinase [Caulobacteraceae bacterium]
MRAVLALNAGSATLKFALYEAQGLALLARGLVDHWGSDAQHFTVRDGAGAAVEDAAIPDAPDDRAASIEHLLAFVARTWPDAKIAAVGHRIVHGGERFTGPALVTAEVEAALEGLCPLAPLHQPWGLTGLRLARAALPGVPQSASFDTAFHTTMPAAARRFALPRELEARGVWRYGFHGLSYAYIAERLAWDHPELAEGRVVVAHLGSGASLCAIRGGRSVETTMGFSTLDGLVMATRPGSLDAGVVLHLIQALGMSAEAVSDMLYHRSGLLGVSGLSGDMRVLLASDEAHAREAVELYVRRIVREVGALTALLGGLDALVFTGGVGENAAAIREAVTRWLGLPAEQALIIPTDEEQVIAREALEVAL